MTRRAALLLLATLFVLPHSGSAQGYGPTSQEEAKLVSILSLSPGRIVGEIGAGDGRLTIRSAKAVGPGGEVFATELGETKLETLKRNLAAAGIKNVEVIEARINGTGLPASCCDAIFMRDVYHHLTAPSEVLADILKALRPEGRLLIVPRSVGSCGRWALARPHLRGPQGVCLCDGVELTVATMRGSQLNQSSGPDGGEDEEQGFDEKAVAALDVEGAL